MRMRYYFITAAGLFILLALLALPLLAKVNYERYRFFVGGQDILSALEEVNNESFSFNSPASLQEFFKERGVGIANDVLRKIPLAKVNLNRGEDSDGDGLSDRIELSFGTDRLKQDSDDDSYDDYMEAVSGYAPAVADSCSVVDESFATKQRGRLFLQVESRGEAWYVADNNKRYYLGTPEEAWLILRGLAAGSEDIDFSVLDKSVAPAAIEPGSLLLPGPVSTVLAGGEVSRPQPQKEDGFVSVERLSEFDCGMSDIAGQMKLFPAAADFSAEYLADEPMICFGKKFHGGCLPGTVLIGDKKGDARLTILGVTAGTCWLKAERQLNNEPLVAYCEIPQTGLSAVENHWGGAAGGFYYWLSYSLAGRLFSNGLNCAFGD